jgi:hypothetical protein
LANTNIRPSPTSSEFIETAINAKHRAAALPIVASLNTTGYRSARSGGASAATAANGLSLDRIL